MPPLDSVRYLDAAQEAVSEEQNRTEEEREAFEEFRRRVSSMTPVQKPGAGTGPTQQSRIRLLNSSSGGMDRVKRAYRETVMSVDHYEQDYAERLPTNMAAELGTGVARAVDSHRSWSPSLKRAIMTACQEAVAKRSDFLNDLEQELAIREAKEVLSGINEPTAPVKQLPPECSFTVLVRLWDELESSEATCENLCRERQTQIQSRKRKNQFCEVDSICEFLYDELTVNYPILAEAIKEIRQLRSYRNRILRQCVRLA